MPRKAIPTSRTQVVSARFSKDEHQAIKNYAKRIGTPPRTFMYQCVMNELKRNNAPLTALNVDPNQLTIADKVD